MQDLDELKHGFFFLNLCWIWRRTRTEIIRLRPALLALGVIHACEFLPVKLALRVSKRFKVPGYASNILRPRKRGFLQETEFSLPHRYHFLRIGRASISITWSRGKCGNIHTSKLFQMSLASGAENPGWSRMYATEISLLRSSKYWNALFSRTVTISGCRHRVRSKQTKSPDGIATSHCFYWKVSI